MAGLSDSEALRRGQYRNSTHLNARAELHRRFSTNRQGWLPWLREQIRLRAGERVLEVGGGPGWLWREAVDDPFLPAGVRLAFSDLSEGMVREARAGLAGETAPFVFAVLAAGSLPFAAGTFDVVLANHMLYHVPDLPAAVSELARVLRPGGRLVAATNGRRHMQELFDLVREVEPSYPYTNLAAFRSFSLETAEAVLAPVFARVTVQGYPDSLWVTEAQPLVDYVCSMIAWPGDGGDSRTQWIEERVRRHLAGKGGMGIQKDSGVAVAYRE